MNVASAVAVASRLRWPGVKLVLAAGAAAALVAAVGCAAGPATPALTGSAVFTALSCKGSSFCLAVGTYPKPKHPDLALIEKWNGRTWQIFPKPRAYSSISCGGPSFCLADTAPPKSPPVTMVWNGKAWRTFKDQLPDGFSGTCASPTFCVTFDNPSIPVNTNILGWTGRGWHDTGASSGCGGPDCLFYALSCATATDCSTSGSYCTNDDCDSTVDFSETWNGSAWVPAASTPFRSGREACAGRSFCMLLALPAGAAVTPDWGNAWHAATANLAAVCRRAGDCTGYPNLACGSPRSCVVLPSARPAEALAWNGASWRAVPMARVGGHRPTLTMVSCGSPRNCTAIGSYQPTPSSTRPVAEHWNGSKWQAVSMPNP
jgi:hypothetical protein